MIVLLLAAGAVAAWFLIPRDKGDVEPGKETTEATDKSDTDDEKGEGQDDEEKNSEDADDGEALRNGWDEEGTHYYRDGELLKGQQTIDEKYYYFSEETGEKQTGWQNIGDDAQCTGASVNFRGEPFAVHAFDDGDTAHYLSYLVGLQTSDEMDDQIFSVELWVFFHKLLHLIFAYVTESQLLYGIVYRLCAHSFSCRKESDVSSARGNIDFFSYVLEMLRCFGFVLAVHSFCLLG